MGAVTHSKTQGLPYAAVCTPDVFRGKGNDLEQLAHFMLVHQPHRFVAPPDKSDRYTLVSIDCFIGRSIETKRALYQAMVQNLGRCGIPADHIKVLLREAPRENWGIRGGQLASSVALEYEVDI